MGKVKNYIKGLFKRKYFWFLFWILFIGNLIMDFRSFVEFGEYLYARPFEFAGRVIGSLVITALLIAIFDGIKLILKQKEFEKKLKKRF